MAGFGFTTKAKILVLSANAYDMKGEEGERVSGCSCQYLFWGEKGETLIPQSEPNCDKPVGQQRAKANLPFDMREKLQVAPAIYVGDFVMSTGSDGKPVLKLVDVAYLCDVSLTEKEVPGIIVPGMVNPPSFAPENSSQPEGKKK